MGIVTLKNVSKIYPSSQGSIYAVRDVNLDIQAGEFYTILGSSGSGKTTILRLIGGLEIPDQGRVLIGDLDPIQQPLSPLPVRTILQNDILFPTMNSAENIAYPLTLAGVTATEIKQRVEAAIDSFQLEGLADRKPQELSTGQQQQVALARALIDRPLILLLDQALSAVDIKIREQVWRTLRELQNQNQITIVYVTHNQEEAMILSDRLAVLHDGKVEQVGTPREVYNHPSSLFVAQFLGKVNLLKGKVINSSTIDINGYLLDIQESSRNAEQKLVSGTEVNIMIRPEKLQINPRTLRDQEIAGTILSCTYVGQAWQYQVSTSMGLLNITKLSTGTGYTINRTVEISWSTEDCIIL